MLSNLVATDLVATSVATQLQKTGRSTKPSELFYKHNFYPIGFREVSWLLKGLI